MAGFMDKVGNMAKKAADKTGDMVEIGMIHTKIMSQKQSISSVKEKIGGLLFEKYQQGEELSTDLVQLCQQIEEIENEIDTLQKEIQEIKE
ncbi:hypothetical protein CLNEO_12830 [Anaerotignum neopropionicum]|uniref:Uncharacterized protein n=1 Tax=Anaerotignum neopropionicum TaxID=36847 RepID=A0A136WFH4_9FIRM|nr:hypothetical protein [Anaerotignum neopropionicum]KXL53312.1 hypothetical protein CLNEO_12830 [Anaerotignum neopropionicum]